MDFGAFAQGLMGGLDHGQQLRARQQQMALQQLEYQDKLRQLQAAAAAFGRGGNAGPTGLPGTGGMPNPPGATFGPGGVPNAPQPPGLLGRTGNFLGNLLSGRAGSPQAGGMGQGPGMPPGGGMPAPALPGVSPGQIPTGPVGPFANGGSGGGMPHLVGTQAGQDGGQDDYSPAGLDRQIQQIANDIRSRNPGITDDVLAEAVSQRVALLSKVGALSSPMERYYAASLADQTKRRGQDIGADTQAGNRQSRETIAGQRDTTQRRGQDLRAKEVDERVSTQRYSAELSNQWHIRGQNLTHEDRQAAISAGIARTQYVQDKLDQRLHDHLITEVQWRAGSTRAANIRNEMNAAQRRTNAIINANPDADPSTNAEYKAASADYEAAAAKLDATDQGMENLVSAAPGGIPAAKPAAAGTPARPVFNPGQGIPGSNRNNPVMPKSLAEARKLPKGTWIKDPGGKVGQVP